ncbi:MAG: serine/threonine-protein kinase [Gemmataceae bacterium]
MAVAADPLVLLNLVFTEISVRLEQGEQPQKSEYLQRFPTIADRIKAEWDRLVQDMPGPAIHEADLPTLSHVEDLRLFSSPLNAPPPQLDDFVYRNILGVGGMGIVYRAQQLSLVREVAIKFLLAQGDAACVSRFQREAHTLASLQHPHIVSVHQTGLASSKPFIVMEYLAGGSLSSLLSKGPLPAARAVEILLPICWAVDEVHQHGYVHRDIKPSNILFTNKGKPKLADFGLAKWLKGAGHTRTGAILGTPSFMAPEQAGAEWPLGPAADIWSLGAVLYACLTGKPPFVGPTELATAKLVCDAQPPALPLTVPEPLRAICMRCLRKNPAERYASAQELAHDLQRWQQGEPIQTSAPLPTVLLCPPHSPLLSRRTLLIAGATTASLGGIAFWLGLPGRDHPRGDILESFRLNGKLIQPRWATANRAYQRTEQGEYLVESSHLALLELLSDPGMDCYRFRVDVRHKRSWGVGIYVGFRTEQKNAHCLVRLEFNDIVCLQARWKEVLLLAAPPPPTMEIPLNPIVLAQSAICSQNWDDDSLSLESVRSEPQTFKAFGNENGPFRTLEIVVDRSEVRGRMLNADLPAEAKLTFEQLREQLEERVRKLPDNDPRQKMDVRFAPRGGLGVFVVRGVAGFRNASLEKL